jgi:hypothetical protein
MRLQFAALAATVKTDRRYRIRTVSVDIVRVRGVNLVSPGISPLVGATRGRNPLIVLVGKSALEVRLKLNRTATDVPRAISVLRLQ